MQDSYLTTLLQMRLLVGFLGERGQFGWWPTVFYEATSQTFLDPVFSKTFRLAQYHGVLEAARRLHDEHLSVGCYHLFRMPEEIEQDLHTLLLSPVGNEIAGKLPHQQDAALEAIRQLSLKDPKASEGPVQAGSIKNIDAPETLRAIAGAYLSAFTGNAKTYPYLVSQS